MFAAGGGASAAYLYAKPRPRNYLASLLRSEVPARDGLPMRLDHTLRPLYVSHTANGLHMLHARCTHLGCVLPWSVDAQMFACPCHGSQFQRDGTYIAGPAPRSLDRFASIAMDANGNVLARSGANQALPLSTATTLVAADMRVVLEGAPHVVESHGTAVPTAMPDVRW